MNVNNRQKIGIYLSSSPSMGGLFQYTSSVFDALASDKTYDLIAIYYNDVWEEYIEKYGLKKYRLSSDNPRQIYTDIHNLNLNLIIYPSQLQRIFLAEIVYDIPFVFAICDLCFYYDKNFFLNDSSITNYAFNVRLNRFANIVNNAESILVDSELGKEQVVNLFGKICSDKVNILPFSIPSYIEKYDTNYVSDLSIPVKYIFYPANFLRYKNHENLILAISKLRDEGIKVNAVFCGNQKKYFSYIQELIKKENLDSQVTILPYATNEDIVFLYKNARAMMMPTLVGPTNIPPLEAMYLGCPTAVSDIGSMPEQVGKEGMIFNPYDVNDIAKCMKKLWLDDAECERLIKNGYKQIKKYSRGVFKGKLLKSVKQILLDLEIKFKNLNKMRECLYGQKVICYGAGKIGYLTLRCCKSLNIQITSILDAYSNEKSLMDVPIIKPNDYTGDKSETTVILSIGEPLQEEIAAFLKKIGFKNFYFITDREIQEYFYLIHCYPYVIK